MSRDFGIDNDGEGFDIDDALSVEELMNIARDGEELEDDDLDTESILKGTHTFEETQFEESTQDIQPEYEEPPLQPETNEPSSIDNAEEEASFYDFEDFEKFENVDTPIDNRTETPTIENTFVDDHQPDTLSDILQTERPSVDRNNYVPEFTEEKIQEEVEYSQIEKEQAQQQVTPVVTDSIEEIAPPQRESLIEEPSTVANEQHDSFAKVQIRKEADHVEEAQKIIATLDTYRNITSESRSIVAQFIHNDNEADPHDEATVIIKALYADPMLEKTMVALQSAATEKDRIQRVFYILELPEKELYSLGSLVSTFTGSEISPQLDKIPFSKHVEEGINQLDDKIIGFVSDTRKVLESARSGIIAK